MFGENKNLGLRDISSSSPLRGESRERLSYTKTNKLITALYMVTDIMDKDEPIRNKLRTLGLEILSDTYSIPPLLNKERAGLPAQAGVRSLDQVLSFLDIASAMNFISEMNSSILKKEFLELKRSIQELDVKPTWLEGFLNSNDAFPPPQNSPHPNPLLIKERGNLNSKGHTRIGVQKGSTLLQALSKVEGMKALSDKTHFMSDRNFVHNQNHPDNFEILKKQRRDNIINIIKIAGGNATITDIKTKNNVQGSALNNVGEKTLQRELISMVKDGVLYKTGEKRWSRYFIK